MFGPIGDSPVAALPFRWLREQYTIPASATEEGQQRLRAYYAALGEFVDMFAQVEVAVTYTLRHYAKTPREVSKVIFSGAKIEISCGYIKQLAEATGASKERRDDLENVLQQLGIINGARNHILHFGANDVAEGAAYVTNALKAKGEPIKFPISPESLGDMTADLRKITFHLHYKHLGRSWPVAASNRDLIEKTLQAPWRYKHPVQPKSQTKEGQSRQPRKRGPKPPRPPRSSRA